MAEHKYAVADWNGISFVQEEQTFQNEYANHF